MVFCSTSQFHKFYVGGNENTVISNAGTKIKGHLNVCGSNPFAIPNCYNTGNGCLTIGDTNIDYASATNSTWGANMGLLMECNDTTEITVHDANTRLASFMYYSSGANAFYIGRTLGWGKTNTAIVGYLHIFGYWQYPNLSTVFTYYNPYINVDLSSYTSINIGFAVEYVAWFKSSVIYVSDERIKMNIQDINDDSALQKILLLEPKTYEYIDKFNKGTKTVYGFISQQIKPIIPEAVSLQSDFIPNINSILNCSGSIISTNEHTNKLKIDDEIKVTKLDGVDETCKVIEINENSVTVDKEISGEKCFVYGSKVDDFHT